MAKQARKLQALGFLRAQARPLPPSPSPGLVWCRSCGWTAPEAFPASQMANREDLRQCSPCRGWEAKQRRIRNTPTPELPVIVGDPVDRMVSLLELCGHRGVRVRFAAPAFVELASGFCFRCAGSLNDGFRVVAPSLSPADASVLCLACGSDWWRETRALRDCRGALLELRALAAGEHAAKPEAGPAEPRKPAGRQARDRRIA